ncbi:MAG: tRNA (N6-isopentenyl adenosine(37)-C2)-methylthiotransferase MiaB [Planctomycetes bacterium]|nr:tRNA (N6-isopentenyl adenosine(37)-C2)-methylthiotransferase MiaB [Planctomycetota bacterium]
MMRLYIETVGCQMNVLDSELVVASLKRQGYELARAADQADTILFNTCSVRQHAEDKVYSALGKLKRTKQDFPDKIVGVLGCMAQKDQQRVFDRAPYVDLVVGPGQLHRVPELIEEARRGAGRQLAVSLGRREGAVEAVRRSHESFDPLRDPEMRPTPFQAYLRIQVGCDKFCAYCVVPMTRGPEQGRHPDAIVAEARTLADQGCLEIVLLGQTVNSYRYGTGPATVRLAHLLERLHAIDGIRRLKFVTGFPKDMTRELLEAVRDLPKVSPYLHVPLQSGSDPVLERMKRGYTVDDYRSMMERIRDTLPDAAVSSDFIVGFCGETEDDFERTKECVRAFRFKNSFIFKYSERSGTKAAERFPDDVPDGIKQRRNNELLEIQNAISEEDNVRLLGRTFDVLVEGPSKTARKKGEEGPDIQMTGRTHCDRIVVFDGETRQAGRILPITIYDASAHTLFGILDIPDPTPQVYSLLQGRSRGDEERCG